MFFVFICGLINPLVEYDPIPPGDHLEYRYQPPMLINWLTGEAEEAPTQPKVFSRLGGHTERVELPQFILGSDHLGRSLAMRLFKSIAVFFFPGLIAGLIAVILGGLLGALAGYLGGRTNLLISTSLELVDTLPRMVVLVLICTIFRPNIMLIALFSAVFFIPSVATVTKRKVEALGAEDYILAHVAHGFHPFKIVTHHILWLLCRGMLIRQMIFVFVYVLFIETALSYLGDYGVQEPNPSWGNMVDRGKDAIVVWPWLFPTAAIIITISSLLTFANEIARRDEEVRR